jgi:vancomycin resistance protein YoaR
MLRTVLKRLLWALPLAAIVVVGVGGAAGALAAGQVLPADGQVAPGTLLDGVAVSGQDAQEQVATRVERLLARRVLVRHQGRTLVEATLAELGLTVDAQGATAALEAVGRSGDWLAQVDESRRAAAGQVAVTVRQQLPLEPLAQRLVLFKDSIDRAPKAARWNFDAKRATAHEVGAVVDVHATVDAVAEAARSVPDGDIEVALVIERTAPAATTEQVEAMDRSSLVAQYDTRFGFVGGQSGRAQNVARAAEGIHGLVMMPGEEMSFNGLVGPRSVSNGFARAGEIYKGEMRMGTGGGTCQVASTFHAAAYMGGLAVVERSPHSRPSGYIGIGLDATVAYPHVDLVMRNPYPFAVAISAAIEEPGRLVVRIYGRQRPAKVQFSAATVGVKKYKRKIRQAHWLPEGEFRRKQPGRRGVTVEKKLTIFFADGTKHEETTKDVYPPTNEVYYVNPNTDPDEVLPPLPTDARG